MPPFHFSSHWWHIYSFGQVFRQPVAVRGSSLASVCWGSLVRYGTSTCSGIGKLLLKKMLKTLYISPHIRQRNCWRSFYIVYPFFGMVLGDLGTDYRCESLNLGQDNCRSLRAPTLDFWLEITIKYEVCKARFCGTIQACSIQSDQHNLVNIERFQKVINFPWKCHLSRVSGTNFYIIDVHL